MWILFDFIKKDVLKTELVVPHTEIRCRRYDENQRGLV